MLVATAAVGLIAPLGAQATDINIEGMNNYSRSNSSKKQKTFNSKTFANEIANTNARVDAVEARFNDFQAGSFSDTTTLGGKAVFVVGAIDNNAELGDTEALTAAYIYSMDLNTSFTGDDNLYVRLKTGDGWDAWGSKPGNYHIENKDQADIMHVDKMWYTFPINDSFSATVGAKIENYYMLAATPSVYKPGVFKAFKLGGHGVAFGASTSTGGGITYKADNGFAVGTTFNSKLAASTTGLFTEEDQNKVNTQVAYTKDNYHVSATYSMQNSWNSWSYYSTNDLVAQAGNAGVSADGLALRAWWRPDETGTATPSISVGYDTVSLSGTTDVKEGSGYFVGFNWADMIQPSDRIGIAFGQPMKATEAAAGATLSEVDPFMWEAYYSFRPNDSIEITPGIFGTTDVENDSEEDIFGVTVSTTFKF